MTDTPIEKTTEKTEEYVPKPKKIYFRDFDIYMNKNVLVYLVGGEIVEGKLEKYDEVSNCILQKDNGRKCLVLGKSIAMICIK